VVGRTTMAFAKKFGDGVAFSHQGGGGCGKVVHEKILKLGGKQPGCFNCNFVDHFTTTCSTI
jgi:hypothetical protein